MNDELTWIKAEIVKILVDLTAFKGPIAENVAKRLGKLLTEYKEPVPTRTESYRAALGLDRLHNGG